MVCGQSNAGKSWQVQAISIGKKTHSALTCRRWYPLWRKCKVVGNRIRL